MPQWLAIAQHSNAYVMLVPETARFTSVVASTDADLNFTKTSGWDDLRVPLTATKLGGSKDPTFAKVLDNGDGSQGVFAYQFAHNQEKEVYFTLQLPHSWKLGSKIYPHVHWFPMTTATGVVCFGLEYTWQVKGAAFGNTNIIYGEKTIATPSQFVHQYEDIDDGIDGAGITEMSSMLMCRVFRDVSVDGNLAAAVALMEIDFHIESDTVGSKEIFSKLGE
jgi:hypothetical protein